MENRITENPCPICGGYGYIEVDSFHDLECGACDGWGVGPPEPTDEKLLRQDGQPEIFDDE